MQWDEVSPEFADVALRADREPPGPARVEAYTVALDLARQHGVFAEEYVARSDLAAATRLVPDAPAMLEHAAWLGHALQEGHDLGPVEREDVLERLLWAVQAAEEDPDVPLDRWRAAVDDLVAAAGAGPVPWPVRAARARLAMALGDRSGVERELAAWAADGDPADDDGCPACAVRERGRLVATSDPGAALTVLAAVVDGGLDCGDEPQLSMSHAADLRSALGDLDGAVDAYRRCWPLVAEDVYLGAAVARCLRVLVRIGNTDRAVDHLVTTLEGLDRMPSPADRMWFAATGAWVLRHGRRLGLAPEEVDGRPVDAVVADLDHRAADLVRRFDARAGTTVVSDALAAALDDRLVHAEPTLPPTHLPATDVDPGRSAPRPSTGPEVVALAARVLEGRRTLEPGVETALRGWAASRDAVLPVLTTPAEWSAASALDRSSAYLLRDPDRERARLRDAAHGATRAGDPEAEAHAAADLAVLDVRDAVARADRPAEDAARSRVHDHARDLEAAGRMEAAAGVWRWYVLTTRPVDAVALLEHAAGVHAALNQPRRQALCLLDAAPLVHADGPEAVEAYVAAALEAAGDHPVVRSQALDVRARAARSAGDAATALALGEQALAAAGSADGTRVSVLFSLCDLLVDLADWERLEARAADALAVAVRLRDPVALAVAQRHLGLAWASTGRSLEAVELLEAALPVVERHVPLLVGPTGWALGNAALELGMMHAALGAFAAAAAAFERAGRLVEAGHARHRAGVAAWDTGDVGLASEHLEHALIAARMSGTPEVLYEASRAKAALRASTVDLDTGLAELDDVLARVERFAAELAGSVPEFDAEVHEPDVLRQGAHLLAQAGRDDDALERLARAEALVGGDFEVVLRAERGIVLAEAGRLDEAEPLLAAALDRLAAAGLVDERVTAAQALATALDRVGRVEDAEALWDRHGPGA